MKINKDFLPINNSSNNNIDELYSCDFINSISDNVSSLSNQINEKEDDFIRGTTLNLSVNVPYLISVKVFSTISGAGGLGIVLGGYDIHWIYQSRFNSSHSGSTYSFTSSGYGTPYATAIRIN